MAQTLKTARNYKGDTVKLCLMSDKQYRITIKLKEDKDAFSTIYKDNYNDALLCFFSCKNWIK